MGNKKIFNIVICIAAIVVIFYFFMNQFGYVRQIKEVKEEKKEEMQNKVWEGKTVGDMEMYLKISDSGAIFEGIDVGFLSVKAKSDKFKYTCGTEQNQKIDDLKKLTYDKVCKYVVFQPGHDGDYSKNTYYFCFVPKDCEYVMVGNDKFDVQKVKINTRTDGELECRVCIFYVKESEVDKAYESDFIAMYDKNGKKYNSAM